MWRNDRDGVIGGGRRGVENLADDLCLNWIAVPGGPLGMNHEDQARRLSPHACPSTLLPASRRSSGRTALLALKLDLVQIVHARDQFTYQRRQPERECQRRLPR